MYVSMKGMLKRANEGNYAVMAINCFNIETARAVINAAQSLRAPIIINITLPPPKTAPPGCRNWQGRSSRNWHKEQVLK